tara:strand:- start:2746 stop:3354 length:609 start_codon:yes stop_codon:yes gene_type:complete
MDIKLESLIEKIKKDGVQEANKTSNGILDKANQEAESIVNKAKKEAESIIKEAKDQAQKLKSNTEGSLKQAARDLVLSLRQQLNSLFDRILKQKISADLDPEYVKQLILTLVDKWALKEDAALEVLVGQNQEKKIAELLFGQIKKEAKNKIELKVAKNIDKGFQIGLKDGDTYYDFTDESILESLKAFLNPTISAMLDSDKQ